MEIYLNGQRHAVEDGATIGQLLENMLPQGSRVAVEVNEEIVPRTRHHEHSLQPGDRVEVVHAIGGG